MIYLVLIPLGILFAPWLLVRYVFVTDRTRSLPYAKYATYLAVAAGLWIAAFFVPNIPISPETDTFGQHTVGGMVATVLFLYAVKAYGLQLSLWWQWLGGVYLFACGLGVLNELFELTVTKTGLMTIEGGDVWWDLLANTIGAYLALAAYGFVRWVRTYRQR